MSHNPNFFYRRSIRLKEYDYSQNGLYFVTICVQNRECLFGDITVGATPCCRPNDDCQPNDNITNIVQPQEHVPTMWLNDAGVMIEKQWLALTDRFPNVRLHEFVVMPDHFHGILEIVGAYPCGRPLCDDNGRQLNNTVASKSDDISLLGHTDALIEINNNALFGQPQGHAPTVVKRKTVGDMMDAFKSIATVEYIRGVKNMGWTPFNGKLWQRGYYEHIIRHYDAFVCISEYIRENPKKWKSP